ncbi:hypothetical protein J6590_093506 [Homalodisca vitripennis]|nr:hypothetical protein J6590_093506 [Homalodisca vitripennis]
MADDNEPEVLVRIRKCVKQVRYNCEVIKEARVKGESYTKWKGNRVEIKREGNIKEIKDRFYSFGSKNEQDAYLQSIITVHDIERRRQVSATNPKPRAHSYTYRVSCSTGSYPVCKKAFITMHDITAMRGFRVKTALVMHNLGLNLSEKRKMHNMFKELNPDSGILYSYYYKIFKERFNYSFGRPQVDTCVTCEELGVWSSIAAITGRSQDEDIIEFKKWWKQYYNGVVLSTESYGNSPKERKIKFHVSRFRHFSYYDSGTVKAREYIDGLDSHTFKLGTGENVVLPGEKAHSRGKLPLKKVKMDDLRKISKSLPHDTDIESFWREIFEWPFVEDTVPDSDDNDGV